MHDLELYAGRWIVVDEKGQIVAVARDGEEALRLAHSRLPKERARLYRVTAHPPHLALPRAPLHLVFTLAAPKPVWIVGGAVRDLLRDEAPHDWDFVLPQGASALARRVADSLGGVYYPLDAERDTARVLHNGLPLDFAALRGASLEEDLRLRDFTINAMALPPDGPLVDPLGGLDDLRAARLRQTSPHAFADDPVRLLRAIRLAAAHRFAIDYATWQQLCRDAALLPQTAVERIREELMQIVTLPAADLALRRMKESGLLRQALPPLDGLPRGVWNRALEHLSAAERLIAGLQRGEASTPRLLRPYRTDLLAYLAVEEEQGVSRAALIKWGTLLTAVPLQSGLDLFGKLRFARRSIRFLGAMLESYIRLADLPAAPDRRAIYRFFHQGGEAAEAAVLLALAEGEHPPVAPLFEAAFRHRERMIAPPPLLDGHDLIALGIPAGPRIGRLLAALEEAQAAGEITSREEAVAFIRRHREA